MPRKAKYAIVAPMFLTGRAHGLKAMRIAISKSQSNAPSKCKKQCGLPSVVQSFYKKPGVLDFDHILPLLCLFVYVAMGVFTRTESLGEAVPQFQQYNSLSCANCHAESSYVQVT